MQSGHLTVVGAGPKAVAIAAKRKVLADLGVPVPQVVVLDGQGTGANWTGEFGYTDGSLPLGTPPEKDVGFPYSSAGYTPRLALEVNTALLQFSWAAFHVLDTNHSYAEWVDRGKPNPKHEHWAEYLEWAADQAEMKLIESDLAHMEITGSHWKVDLESGDQLETDGVVITSPGPPRRQLEIPEPSEWIFDGKNFWLDDTIKQIAARVEERQQLNACVIGSGETAAAIVVSLDRLLGPEGSIAVISKEGIIYTRGESYEENRLYSSPEAWRNFPEATRRQFVKRTDRGVFSVSNKAVLNRSESVRTLSGSVRSIKKTEGALCLDFHDREPLAGYDLVVDATGFEREWFFPRMGPRAQKTLLDQLKISSGGDAAGCPAEEFGAELSRALDQCVGLDLSVGGLKPHLHLPMHAALEQGPGFPNLSCLGLLSDRILQCHCPSDLLDLPENLQNTEAEPKII